MPDTPKTPPVEFTPDPDSKLAQLSAELADVESQLGDLTKREKELRDQVKVEMGKYVPEGATQVVMVSPYLGRRKLTEKKSMRFQEAKFKAEQLEMYCRYTVEKSTWFFEKS